MALSIYSLLSNSSHETYIGPCYLLLAGIVFNPVETGISQEIQDKDIYEILPIAEVYRHACKKPYMKEEILLDGKPNIAACYEKKNARSCFKDAEEGKLKNFLQLFYCLSNADMLLSSSRNDGIYDEVQVNPTSSCYACHSGNKVGI